MEQNNREPHEAAPQAELTKTEQAAAPAEPTEAEKPAAPGRVDASGRLLSYAQNATESERIIMEQMASKEREPRITPIGKKSSAMLGIILIAACVPILLIGFLLVPDALPLLVAGSVMLVLMGAWRISTRNKRPCVCPYCAYFDDIADDIIDYTCPRCENESVRVGNELHPKGAHKQA